MIKTFKNFFEEKVVLITGHTGFIGSWLSIVLNELSADLIGYALPPYTRDDNFVVSNLKEKMVSIIGDIRDFDNLNSIVKKHKPDIIFHLAAQPIVTNSYLEPKETYDINVGGTVNIFETFRRNDHCKLLINCTTDKVYENLELKRGYNENDRLGGFEPYSSSKACSEIITSSYRDAFFNSESSKISKLVSSVRCGNIIGGGDWQEHRIIPDCMRAIKKNQKIIVRNPTYIRPWQYVLEPIWGFLILTKKMWEEGEKFIGAWNFGPTDKNFFSVREIVEKIINFYGKGAYTIDVPNSIEKFHETKTLLLDSSKAYKLLGWKPKLSIDQSIKFVCDWYREENINYEFNVKQINDYFKIINNKAS
ncbi:MAG: CDP-glucose 4,6-dehydratase [Promethearchaeota archaeon]